MNINNCDLVEITVFQFICLIDCLLRVAPSRIDWDGLTCPVSFARRWKVEGSIHLRDNDI